MDNNGYVGSSMARTKATWSAMFSDVAENGLIAMNPVTKSVKCPKKPEKNTKVLTLDEQERKQQRKQQRKRQRKLRSERR